MSLWTQWLKGFREYITANLGNSYTDEIETSDRLITFKEDSGANQYDRIITIAELAAIIQSSGISITDGQIVVGTGTGVEGTTKFTYDDTASAEVLTLTGRIEVLGTGNSIFIGEDAGLNDSFGFTAHNIFIGVDSGGTGDPLGNYRYNIGIGRLTLNNISSGSANIALCSQSLEALTTGIQNFAAGQFSLQVLAGSSNNNICIGYQTFRALTSGSSNVAFGLNAGYKYNGISYLLTSSNSVFIGANTGSKADNSSNEIVIGANAIGNGDDTATILDDNGTDVWMGENGQCVMHSKSIKTTLLSGALTNPPTAAELISLIGVCATLGSGYEVNVYDSANAIMYNVNTDGTDWFYVAKTKAV
jgi:hypothetical protein